MYVDYKIEEYSEEVFKLLDEGAHIYFCASLKFNTHFQELQKQREKIGKWS